MFKETALSGRDDHKASISASTFLPALPSSPALLQLHINNIIATVGPGATTGHSLVYVTIQHHIYKNLRHFIGNIDGNLK